MDRLTQLLSPRLVLPLLGAILACLPWLALRLDAPQQGSLQSSPTLGAGTAPGVGVGMAKTLEGATKGDSPIFVERKLGQSPGAAPHALGATLAEGAKLLKFPAPGGDAAVLAAAFPSMPADAKGPELLAPGASPPAAPASAPPRLRTPCPCRPARCCCLRKRRRRGASNWRRPPSRPTSRPATASSWPIAGPAMRPGPSSSPACGCWPRALDAERHTTQPQPRARARADGLEGGGRFPPQRRQVGGRSRSARHHRQPSHAGAEKRGGRKTSCPWWR